MKNILNLLTKNHMRIRVLQYFFLMYVLYSLIIANVGLFWISLGVAAYMFFETFGGNIGLHRYFGHKSFETTLRKRKFLMFCAHYIGVSSVLSWVGQHRHHHRYSDTPNDVHSPEYQGKMKIIFGIWEMSIDRMLIRDVLKDDSLRLWHDNYWVFHLLLISIYFAVDSVFNTHFLFALYCLPNLMCLISGYMLAITAHWHGYKTYDLGDDKATNSWLVNIYTLGEGWHNNHHAHPKRLRQGEKWWEWDLQAWVIEKFLKI